MKLAVPFSNDIGLFFTRVNRQAASRGQESFTYRAPPDFSTPAPRGWDGRHGDRHDSSLLEVHLQVHLFLGGPVGPVARASRSGC